MSTVGFDGDARAGRPGLAGHDLATRALLGLAILAYATIVLKTAWLSDDAYITLRTVRNFVEGEGLRWNVVERVQTYTHPLWLFVLSGFYAITREAYYGPLAASILASLMAVWVVARKIAPTPLAGFACVTVLLCSRSFVDYSTSGLENPLTHLLVALLAATWLADEIRGARGAAAMLRLGLVSGLCALNRLDTLFLSAPLLGFALLRAPDLRSLLALALGLSPLFLWELFALVYYGFPFPNPAYAKLPAEVPVLDRMRVGVGYLASSASFDPLAALVIAGGGLALPLVTRSWYLLPLCTGIAGYVLYTIYIGGDFMAGRFLTAPLVMGLAVAAHAPAARGLPVGLAAVAAALALGLAPGERSPLLSASDFGGGWGLERMVDRRGVADERAVYYRYTGLLRAGAAFRPPRHPWIEQGEGLAPGAATVAENIGLMGFAAPRDAYIIDWVGLGDPLMARLPPARVRGARVGHYYRRIPGGYVLSREAGENLLRDDALARYFDRLRLITEGPIWSVDRWSAIWDLNLGRVRALHRSAESA